jgi:hypothetical protein
LTSNLSKLTLGSARLVAANGGHITAANSHGVDRIDIYQPECRGGSGSPYADPGVAVARYPAAMGQVGILRKKRVS